MNIRKLVDKRIGGWRLELILDWCHWTVGFGWATFNLPHTHRMYHVNFLCLSVSFYDEKEWILP